jgi:Mg-chelatase subunit ChlD
MDQDQQVATRNTTPLGSGLEVAVSVVKTMKSIISRPDPRVVGLTGGKRAKKKAAQLDVERLCAAARRAMV